MVQKESFSKEIKLAYTYSRVINKKENSQLSTREGSVKCMYCDCIIK